MIQCKYNAPNVSYATMQCANNAYNKYQKYMLQYSLNQKLDIVEQYNYMNKITRQLRRENIFGFKQLHYKSARPAGCL